jgi:hypothetical protein
MTPKLAALGYDEATRIRFLNDLLRSTGAGGRIFLTQGIAALSEREQSDIAWKVRAFDDFTEDNDPHREHSFGAFTHDGHMGVREAALVMVAERQPRLDVASLHLWAEDLGIGLTLFHGWEEFIDQALFWAAMPKPEAARQATGFIHQRLIKVEVSPESVTFWADLISTT